MKKVETQDFYICDVCESDLGENVRKDSLNSRWCPCPKSSCEARIIGEVIITTEIVIKR